MNFKPLFLGVVFAVSSLSLFANHHSKKDLVDTAVAAGQFQTLAAALGAADLVDALKGEGPFTVFAPTDEAFAKLPDGTIESLLKPENRDQLVDILTYHVVPARVLAKQAVKLDEAETLGGKVIDVELRGDVLFLNDAKVVKTDIEASNGVIHVIDTVLIPGRDERMSVAEISSPAKQLLMSAIGRGAPLYNHGNAAACAAVYATAAEALLLMPKDTLAASQRTMLQTSLQRAMRQNSPSDQAWTLREAFDSLLDRRMENI
ncbi:MAG: hypothetical protein SynsKO_04830 [Synoicihabitans sp.]